jgi:hypothetical protein
MLNVNHVIQNVKHVKVPLKLVKPVHQEEVLPQNVPVQKELSWIKTTCVNHVMLNVKLVLNMTSVMFVLTIPTDLPPHLVNVKMVIMIITKLSVLNVTPNA